MRTDMIDQDKNKIVEEFIQLLNGKGFRIVDHDLARPWGGFCVIDENQVQQFALMYFGVQGPDVTEQIAISGKILFVAPRKRLSWQYHRRRNELWRVLRGTVGVVTSETDEENELRLLNEGDQIGLPAGTRHRLVGLDHWGVIAEVWEHTVPGNPSNESDIVRIQDDFDR